MKFIYRQLKQIFMVEDLRAKIIHSIPKNLRGLSFLAAVSTALAEEQKQLRAQQGPKKTTDITVHLGVIPIRIKTVYDGGEIQLQNLKLVRSSGEGSLYLQSREEDSLLIYGNAVFPKIPLALAVDIFLRGAYGPLYQPN